MDAMAIRNQKCDSTVEPGKEFTIRIVDETWPKPWPDETPMMLICQPALLRIPCYADGDAVVCELNAADTVFPQPSVGFCIAAFYDGRMHRIASGVLRRA